MRYLDRLRQPCDSRLFEQTAQRHILTKCITHACDNLRGQQRVTAKFEEIVFNSNVLYVEQLTPDTRNDLFCRSARRNKAGPQH